MSCEEERRPVTEFMLESILYFVVLYDVVAKSSLSLSHLLMSFL